MHKAYFQSVPLLPLFQSLTHKPALDAIADTGNHILSTFSHVAILGTGGSTLNPQASTALAKKNTASPVLHFIDHVDPHAFEDFLTHIPCKETAFLVISKSFSHYVR